MLWHFTESAIYYGLFHELHTKIIWLKKRIYEAFLWLCILQTFLVTTFFVWDAREMRVLFFRETWHRRKNVRVFLRQALPSVCVCITTAWPLTARRILSFLRSDWFDLQNYPFFLRGRERNQGSRPVTLNHSFSTSLNLDPTLPAVRGICTALASKICFADQTIH